MTSEPSPWTLARIWDALTKLWAIVVATTILGSGIAYVDSASTTPVYSSTSTLSFSISQGTTAADLANGSTYMQAQMLTYAQLATSSAVLQPVIDNLSLQMRVPELRSSIVATIPQNTLILKIQVSVSDRELAADLANAIGHSVSTVVGETSPKPTSGEAPRIVATVVDEALVPKHQSAPDKKSDTIMGGMAGLVIGLLIVLVRAMTETRILNEEELRRVTSTPILGAVNRSRSSNKLWASDESAADTTEQLRRIRSALKHAMIDDASHRILVASAGVGEGKSTISANLALTIANLGSKVLLIDADLRSAGQSDIFGVDGLPGLHEVLRGEASFDGSKKRQARTTLDILPAGEKTNNPAVLLASDRMHELLEDVAGRYDYVIVDTPAMGKFADASLLAPMVDSAIVVVDTTKSRRAGLIGTLSNLEISGGRVVGLIMNRGRTARFTLRRRR